MIGTYVLFSHSPEALNPCQYHSHINMTDYIDLHVPYMDQDCTAINTTVFE